MQDGGVGQGAERWAAPAGCVNGSELWRGRRGEEGRLQALGAGWLQQCRPCSFPRVCLLEGYQERLLVHRDPGWRFGAVGSLGRPAEPPAPGEPAFWEGEGRLLGGRGGGGSTQTKGGRCETPSAATPWLATSQCFHSPNARCYDLWRHWPLMPRATSSASLRSPGRHLPLPSPPTEPVLSTGVGWLSGQSMASGRQVAGLSLHPLPRRMVLCSGPSRIMTPL